MFISSLPDKYKEAFWKATGIIPSDIGSANCVVFADRIVAKSADSSMRTCGQFGLKAAKTPHIVKTLEDAKGSFKEIPRNEKDVNIIIKNFYRDSLRLRPKDIEQKESEYNPQQKAELRKLIRRRKDIFLGRKLILMLNVDSSDHKICLRASDLFCSNMGGSYSLADQIIDYMQDVGMPYEKLLEAVVSFDTLWAKYLSEFVSHAVDENISDFLRLTAEAVSEAQFKKMSESLN